MVIERERDVTAAALAAMQRTSDPRLREIMVSLVKHLHGFVRDVRLTEAEFRDACAILIELNEAFASQGIACLRQLGVKEDADFVNPHGGAIALGHPLGMSGARLVLTAAHGMETRGGKLALATMCVGVGQGVAVAIEKLN